MSNKIDDAFFKLVRSFLTVYLPKNRCYSTNTVKAYRDTINLFRIFFQEHENIPFSKINFALINHSLVYEFLQWLQIKRNCGVSTRNQRLAALKSFLHYCAIEDPALTAIYMDIRAIPALRETKKGVSYLSNNALKEILAEPNADSKLGMRNRFLMILLYDTGARIQEVLDLKVKDFCLEFDTPLVYVTGKGNRIRALPLMDKTIQHLEQYMNTYHPQYPKNGDNYLFYTIIHGRKQAMSADNVSVFIKKYARLAKKRCPEIPDKIHAHLFRHSRAMHLYQSGIPLSYIKDFLGHVSATTTGIYASADTSMIKNALEKAAYQGSATSELPIWTDNEDMILKICGLK